MPPPLPNCGIKNIPSRLHTKSRSRISAIARDDRLYIRHAPLRDGCEYGFQIPGHDHLEDQSANSDHINGAQGYACDVLFDCKHGEHHVSFQIACVDVFCVNEISIPNENTVRKGRDGAILEPADIYTFEVIHEPTPCMYPHCVIQAKKNGTTPKKVSSGVKTAIRLKFADLAERNRVEMTTRRAQEFPKWDRERKRLNHLVKWIQKIEATFVFCAKPFAFLYRKIFNKN